ncbi:putative uncharacterized protein FLJ46214 [Oryctolagus cuniculus]|uniref:putative uncharacterized protein FLJ46214 n=1 Tax=Oryctolagus cuniculus TaxID=9986 RepID=UPI0038796E41
MAVRVPGADRAPRPRRVDARRAAPPAWRSPRAASAQAGTGLARCSGRSPPPRLCRDRAGPVPRGALPDPRAAQGAQVRAMAGRGESGPGVSYLPRGPGSVLGSVLASSRLGPAERSAKPPPRTCPARPHAHGSPGRAHGGAASRGGALTSAAAAPPRRARPAPPRPGHAPRPPETRLGRAAAARTVIDFSWSLRSTDPWGAVPAPEPPGSLLGP